MSEDLTIYSLIYPNNVKDAKRIGAQFYFTGTPCKNGHICTRRTINHNCSECVRTRQKSEKYKIKKRARRDCDEYREQARQYVASYKEKTPLEERQARSRKYKQNELSTPQGKLKVVLRKRLWSAFKNNQKTGSAINDLGCSIDELKIHLENQFKEGMNWDNHGKFGWHIDHIKPLSSFDLTKREELLVACHYSNLQPLWWYENLQKHDKILD